MSRARALRVHEPEPEDYLYKVTGEQIFKKPYVYWTEKWWNWLLDKPRNKNPAKDRSGSHSDSTALRKNSPVFFLAGEVEGKSKRSGVEIRRGQAILFPLVNYEWSYFEMLGFVPKPTRQAVLTGKATITAAQRKELKEFTQEFLDYMYSLDLVIDEGEESQLTMYTGQLCKYRVDSDFDINFCEGNLFNTDDGRAPASEDGYWVFIRPDVFELGKHTIWFRGITLYYQNEVHYTIDIVK
jgi:hypothetical protein